MKNNIVAAIDFSTMTPVVIEQAAKEARLRPGCELHLVHVLAAPMVAPVGAMAPVANIDMTAALDATREELQRAARGANLAGLKVVGHVRIGASVAELCAIADEVEAELLVVGASAKGLAMRALLGSTSHPLMSRSPCSVLVARPRIVPEIEPARQDQNDDVHKRHHPAGHPHSEPPDRSVRDSESFRFGIQS